MGDDLILVDEALENVDGLSPIRTVIRIERLKRDVLQASRGVDLRNANSIACFCSLP